MGIIWQNVLRDSSGAGVDPGLNAAADFAAGCRIVVPDERNKVAAMVDPIATLNSMSGVNIGSFGGYQSVALQVSELPAHNHTIPDQNSNVAVQSGTDINITQTSDPSGSVTGDRGDGAPHCNVQPTILINVAIKL